MKILIATGIYPPEQGGPATYSRACAQAMIERGHEVTVIAYGEDEERGQLGMRDEKTRVIWVSRRGGALVRYLRYAWMVYRVVQNCEIIFAQGAVSEGFPAMLVGKITGKKVIMRIPGDYAWEMGMQCSRAKTEASLDRFLGKSHGGIIGIYEKVERWTARQAWSLIVPSQYLRSVAERWGVPKERITVIKNAVQPLPTTVGRTVLRKRLKMNDQIVCLTAVRAVPWKGVEDLIRWWHRLPADYLLVVAGDGPELENWKRVAKEEGMKERIRFLGKVSREVLTEWYDVADVFLLHTGYEGYPHTVPEAVSRGLPCIISDQGGNPETKEEYGENITILPYQDRDAWVNNLLQLKRGQRKNGIKDLGSHYQMMTMVEERLKAAVGGAQGHARTVMVSYERGLIKTESEAFARITSLTDSSLSISALVIARFPEDIVIERDGVYAQAFSGSSFRRVWHAIIAGIKEAKRLPGRTVISGQDPFAAGIVAYLISRWTNQPLELQEHGDFWAGPWVRERWTHRLWSWIGIILLQRAEGVRVVSERVKDHLVSHGVSAQKIEVIPVAQSLERFFEQPLLPHVDNKWVLRVPCRFVPQKGLDVLLEAFIRVHERHLNTRLEIVGAGQLEGWLRTKIEKSNLGSAVTIEPWVAQSEVYTGADVLVVGSRYEGWGRTIVEAMAAGVPVVTTEVGCVGTCLRPNIDGLVVPVDDAEALAQAIIVILEDNELRERMRLSARERVRTFPSRAALHQKQRTWWRRIQASVQGHAVGPRFEVWVLAFIGFIILTRAMSVVLFHNQLLNREYGFFTLVQHWFQGYGYSFANEIGCPSAYRSPGYLFFLTGLYTLFDPSNTWAQAIIQNVFVIGALWLTYAVGKRLVGSRAGLLGGVMMACYPYTFYHYTQYYHTFLQSFFLLLVIWCVLRLADTKKLSYALYSGIAIGVLAYVQGTILPITPFIALWVLWQMREDKKRACAAVALMGICSATLIAPWAYRNWNAFHHFIPLTTDLGHALIKANNENIYELTKRGFPQEIIEDVASSTNPLYKQYRLPNELELELKKADVFRESILWTEWHPKEPTRLAVCEDRGLLDEYQFNQYWLQKTKEQWRMHWGWEVWRLPLQKIRTFWQPGLFPTVKTGAPWSFAGTAWKEWAARASVWVSSAVVIIFGLLGIGMHVWRRRHGACLVVACLLVYTLLHALVAGYTKYRIPLDHFLAMYAAWSLLQGWRWVQRKNV